MIRDRNSRLKRRGMILAMVLVALVVVMLIGAAMANQFIAQRRLARQSGQQQQASWLADSAVQRAAYQLSKDADYSGETWQIDSDDLGGSQSGVVVIQVEATANPQQGYQIVVDATLSTGSVRQTRQHREQFVGSIRSDS